MKLAILAFFFALIFMVQAKSLEMDEAEQGLADRSADAALDFETDRCYKAAIKAAR